MRPASGVIARQLGGGSRNLAGASIPTVVRPANLLKTAWDAWRNGRTDCSTITIRQRSRLYHLVAFARAHSPLYRRLYSLLPAQVDDLHRLPPATKTELLADLDDWVTDPAVTEAGVKSFLVDNKLVGHLYLDRYALWTTPWSGGGVRRMYASIV